MEDQNTPHTLNQIPGFHDLPLELQDQLRAMRDNMVERNLPPSVVESGLRSTAKLLLEQRHEQTPRMETEPVRHFLEANRGTPISRRSRAVPRKETKARARERLHDQVAGLLVQANTANRRHEMLRVRREMLSLDQGYIRRVLGEEGDVMCHTMNAWLIEAATRLNRG